MASSEIEAILEYLDRLDALMEARRFEALTTGVERPWQEVHSSIDVSSCRMVLIGVSDLDELSAVRRLSLQMTLAELEEKYPPLELLGVAS